MNLKDETYMKQGMDLKRLVLVLGRKLWLILAAVILGAFFGGFTYKIVTNIIDGEPEYRASADYYITFLEGEGVNYYNAYTWNGILKDDPIVDYALELLPKEITKDMVKAAVSGEMLSDYRILTVHVNAETKEKADMIAKAYEESLWHFGQEMDLLDKVELWSQEEAVPFEKNTKTVNAAFLGSLIAMVIMLFALLFYYLLEDAVYVERDAKERFGLPVYGLLTRNKDALQHQMFADNMEYVFGDKKRWGDDIIRIWPGEQIPAMKDFEQLRTEKRLLVDIPWGRNNCRQIERVLEQLQIQGIKVDGIVITEAEDKFVKAYYMIERRKECLRKIENLQM